MTDFGKDTSCTTSIKSGRFVTGARLVAEAAFRRLITPRGSLRGGEDEADYGLDLLDLIGATSTKSELASIEGRIRNELTKDDRIDTVTAQVTANTSGPVTTWSVEITATTAAGPFNLVLSVSDVSVQLLGITA